MRMRPHPVLLAPVPTATERGESPPSAAERGSIHWTRHYRPGRLTLPRAATTIPPATASGAGRCRRGSAGTHGERERRATAGRPAGAGAGPHRGGAFGG